jgi:thiol:disulfide interchange protein
MKINTKKYYVILFTISLFFRHALLMNTIFEVQEKRVPNPNHMTLKAHVPQDTYIINNSISVFQNQEQKPVSIVFSETGTIISGKNNFEVIYNPDITEIEIQNIYDYNNPITVHYSLFNNQTGMIENYDEVINSQNQSINTEKNPQTQSSDEKSCKNLSLDGFLQNALEKNNTVIILIIIFLLGLLMSLTPCIYPMIPITISILGIEQKSFSERFVAGLLYMLGIATTFSIIGLLTASGKLIFGNIFSNPIFLIITTIILLLMTLNMLGLISHFLNFQTSIALPEVIEKSIFLPFFYGLFSGTITSPCVSPGLLGLLTIINQQNNIFLGWLWLFIFGCGLAFPLFLIALASNTAFQIPGSGSWMNTLKEFLGVILLFVINKNLLLITNFTFSTIIICSIFTIYLANKIYQEKRISYTAIIMSITFGGLFFMLYQNHNRHTLAQVESQNEWIFNFDTAQELAKRENKLLFVDIGAEWCSICIEVEKQLLHTKDFTAAIGNRAILCKIDCTKPSETNQKLLQKYNIKGLPALLCIDPHTLSLLKSYNGNILNMTLPQLITDLESLNKKDT